MDGVIVLNKTFGRTSHDMVSFIRKVFKIKKVGHTGTLDPAATGVLPICIGKATKTADMLTASDKSYVAEIVFGMTTDTLDAEGEILSEQPYDFINKEKLLSVINNYIGEIYQIPPMFSAIKKNGKKLYELARNGITIEREKRLVNIKNIKLLSFDSERGTARISVDCSKGTYIRSLCDDIGAEIGCGAYMNSLERTASGRFKIEESYTEEDILKAKENGTLLDIIKPIETLFPDYPKIYLNEKQSQLVKNGVRIYYKGLKTGMFYRIFDNLGNFIAISEFNKDVLILNKSFWN